MIQNQRFNSRFTPLNPADLYARLDPLAFTSEFQLLARHEPTGGDTIGGGKRYTSLAQVGRRLLWHFLFSSVGSERMRIVCAATGALAINLCKVNRGVVIQGMIPGVTYALYSNACRAVRSFNEILLALPGARHRCTSRSGSVKVLLQAGTLVKNILTEMHKRPLEANSIPSSSVKHGGVFLLLQRNSISMFSGFGIRVGGFKRIGTFLRTHGRKKFTLTSSSSSNRC